MDKCSTCINGRGIISEDGWHYICCLSSRKAVDCATNKKDYYITIIGVDTWEDLKGKYLSYEDKS